MSMRLRSPPKSTEDRQRHKDEIVEELYLQKARSSIIGTAFRRGISGGERKRFAMLNVEPVFSYLGRTSIAMELTTNPSVLFLDEPTSGLDGNVA